MWLSCLIISVASIVLFGAMVHIIPLCRKEKGKKVSLFRMLFAGVFAAAFFMFLPIHAVTAIDPLRTVLLSLFNAMQIFTLGTEFAVISAGVGACPPWLSLIYQAWAVLLLIVAPIFTFGAVLSLFRDLSAHARYLLMRGRTVYVFSALNERSLSLATDLKKNMKRVGIVFHGVFADSEEQRYELMEKAKQLGAVCFRKDVLSVNYRRHSAKQELYFFTISEDEAENLDQALGLMERYRDRKLTNLYMFSSKLESELLLAAQDQGEVKIRRINEVQSLINRLLYEQGARLFEQARKTEDGKKEISAVVVGMGRHGTEMVKALSWFCQMDGYRVKITAFDKDKMAAETFRAKAPELMSEAYNGVEVEGEAQYEIKIYPKYHVESAGFAERIAELGGATYVFVALGDDEVNIRTAVELRMLFERCGCHPIIQAVLRSSRRKQALDGIKNYRGQPYDIEWIGDVESCYTEEVIMNSALEKEALQRHLKWGKEEEFWAYEYNYRSSVASAIHMRARIRCGIPGADKTTEELTQAERDGIEVLEHKRWNAYMRAEGYVYSGSSDKASRNDLAKMHHDLVDFSQLSEAEKRKDSSVGSK